MRVAAQDRGADRVDVELVAVARRHDRDRVRCCSRRTSRRPAVARPAANAGPSTKRSLSVSIVRSSVWPTTRVPSVGAICAGVSVTRRRARDDDVRCRQQRPRAGGGRVDRGLVDAWAARSPIGSSTSWRVALLEQRCDAALGLGAQQSAARRAARPGRPSCPRTADRLRRGPFAPRSPSRRADLRSGRRRSARRAGRSRAGSGAARCRSTICERVRRRGPAARPRCIVASASTVKPIRPGRRRTSASPAWARIGVRLELGRQTVDRVRGLGVASCRRRGRRRVRRRAGPRRSTTTCSTTEASTTRAPSRRRTAADEQEHPSAARAERIGAAFAIGGRLAKREEWPDARGTAPPTRRSRCVRRRHRARPKTQGWLPLLAFECMLMPGGGSTTSRALAARGGYRRGPGATAVAGGRLSRTSRRASPLFTDRDVDAARLAVRAGADARHRSRARCSSRSA